MEHESEPETKKNSGNKTVNLIFRSVAAAMGIAVAVLAVLEELDTNAGMVMLGIGLACLTVYTFREQE